ncbi:hypothetical protein [Reichenbachiella ulvae]|uniref:Uncharacterized protein n=1 Tax=Reichenbachiella ulvae TaxID=2980104 RepID=A0ABT3CRB2_9BACT|nr:hypothetical protein [Reichenbachiella ulvae]MCV9386202.1 hypothetical protein [Reichenbachiella ulvae]
MESLEIFAIGWAIIALIIFGLQASQAQSDNKKHEEQWDVKSPNQKN